MKCLSLIRPWASLVACGEKRYETRSWRTAHRGPLLIASSRSFPPQCRELCLMEPFASALDIIDGRSIDAVLLRGFILAVVEVVECYRTEDVTGLDDIEQTFGDYRLGRWAWQL